MHQANTIRYMYMRFVENEHCFSMWCFGKDVSHLPSVEDWCLLKTLHPGRVPEGILEAIPEGFRQYAKPRIPEGYQKVREAFPEGFPGSCF